jgi:hypothetical protein
MTILATGEVQHLMASETITPAVLYLVSEQAPSRIIMGAGAGTYAVTHIFESEGVFLREEDRTPESIAALFSEIADVATARPLASAFKQTDGSVRRTAAVLGVAPAENRRDDAGRGCVAAAVKVRPRLAGWEQENSRDECA